MQQMKQNHAQRTPVDHESDKASTLSAFMDGEASLTECTSLMQAGVMQEASPVHESDASEAILSIWAEYHVISRVLQGQPVLPHSRSDEFLERWRNQIGSSTPEIGMPAHREQAGHVVSLWGRASRVHSANDARWQWATAAGVVGLAVALIWSLQPPANLEGSLAEATTNSTLPGQAAIREATIQGHASVQKVEDMAMIRNSALDELLLAHRRQGGASALQVPAGFMRGASSSNSP